MGLMKNVAANSRATRVARNAGAAGRVGSLKSNVSIDLSDWDRWMKQLAGLTRAKQHAILKKAMKPETKKMMDAIKARARALVRKGRQSTRQKGVGSLMRIVANKLKLRVMKRSRTHAGHTIFIGATGPEIEQARGKNPATRFYAPAHFVFGFKTKAGKSGRGKRTLVRGNNIFKIVMRTLAARWFKAVGQNVEAGLMEHFNKEGAKFRKTA